MKYQRLDASTIAIAGKRIRLPGEVGGHVSFPDRVVLLLDPDPTIWKDTDPTVSRNVCCFGDDGRLLWKVEDPDIYVMGDDRKIEYYDSFLALYLDDRTGELRANSAAVSFVIDKDTGKIIRAESKD